MSGPALVADIGGTNARFALADLSRPVPSLGRVRTLPGERFASLRDACRHYLDAVGAQPRAASFALACPVDGDEVSMTNRAWSFRRDAFARELGIERLLLLNDFDAIARAVPALGTADVAHLHGPDALPPRAPVTVIGPGTGLGVALLTGNGAEGWTAIGTEGGHATFAPVDEVEREIARRLDGLYGRTSNERVLSGAGLAHIDAVLRGLDPDTGALPMPREPAEVVSRALDGGDPCARHALDCFCAILGSVCGDAALMHGARSVVIAGGIVPRFLPFLRDSRFRERFLAKGRFSGWMEKVSVHAITHPQPGLLGAAMALRGAKDG